MSEKLRILLATDFSEAVMNAERYAVQLARYLDAELVVVHAADANYNLITDTLSDTRRSKAASKKSMQQEVTMHCEHLFKMLDIKTDGLRTRCLAEEGKPAEVICAKAEYLNADIIIVGTHGRTGFRNILYGTHAWEIMRKAKRPVIAVPEGGMFTGFERIVFATEQRKGEAVSLYSLIRLFENFRPAISLLHITRRLLTKKETLAKIEAIRLEMSRSLSYGRIGVHVLRSEKIITGLNKFCETENADLLIMSPRGLSGLMRLSALAGSIAKKMSFYSHTPVMIVPDYYVRHSAKIPKSFELNEELF